MDTLLFLCISGLLIVMVTSLYYDSPKIGLIAVLIVMPALFFREEMRLEQDFRAAEESVKEVVSVDDSICAVRGLVDASESGIIEEVAERRAGIAIRAAAMKGGANTIVITGRERTTTPTKGRRCAKMIVEVRLQGTAYLCK